MKKALGVIPARLQSTRFPGKPLVEFFGKPMIEHTYNAACGAQLLSCVMVTSDSDRVLRVIERIGGKTMRTTSDCATGTDRIVQALSQFDSDDLAQYDIVVNIQGDEPGVNAHHIDACIQALRQAESDCVMSTLATRITTEQEATSRDVVKVVADRDRNALYFSRALIPHTKDGRYHASRTYLRHVGLYAFRRDFLLKFLSIPRPSIEQCEDLEQLRVLYAGHKIKLVQVDSTLPGVDTEQDLERLKTQWKPVNCP